MNISDIFKYESVEDFISAKGQDYCDRMAEILSLALTRDANLYEWCILNFNDIMDKDKAAIEYIFEKIGFIKDFFLAKDPEGVKECRFSNYGSLLARGLKDYFKDELSYGQCWGLGMIAVSNISYKRQLLSKEEFYEIRDMFVPFGLTISLDKYDVDSVLDIIKGYDDYEDEMADFVLLKKIGKAAFYKNVSEDEIKAALSELYVEWD